MALYKVFVFCDYCDNPINTAISVFIDEPIPDKSIIHDVYSGRALPESLLKIKETPYRCATTGKDFLVRDNRQAFLVAYSE